MTIDIELSLFVNLVLNSFILFLTGYFFKEKPKLWFLSSLIGATIALVMPGLYLPSYAKILAQVFLSLVMVSLSFDVKPLKKFVYRYITFLAMTFLFGGGCYALSSTLGSLPLVAVVGTSVVIFCAFKAVIFYRNRQKIIENFSFKVKIKAKDKEIEETASLEHKLRSGLDDLPEEIPWSGTQGAQPAAPKDHKGCGQKKKTRNDMIQHNFSKKKIF